MTKPLVSVVMPVYNCEQYIIESVKSVLNQTYHNLELLIVNDASTDRTSMLVSQLIDNRIRIFNNTNNIGLAGSINFMLTEAKGKYIARMDADDIALPQRLEKQVQCLESNPKIDVLGTAMQSFGYSNFLHQFPTSHEECKAQLLFNVCFGHPTVMMRSEIFLKSENYYQAKLRQYSEEYELWCRLVDHYRFSNLEECLLKYRTFSPSEKSDAANKRKKNSFQIRKHFIEKNVGIQSDTNYLLHDSICNLAKARSMDEFKTWREWLVDIVKINSSQLGFNERALLVEVSKRYFELCYHNTQLGLRIILYWMNERNLLFFRPTISQKTKFLIRATLRLSTR
jgi:glycosyltransferase involved in cell wall biosynthesis